MTHLELPLFDQSCNFGCQLEQSQQIADRRARTADRIGRLLMGDPELGDEPVQGARFFQRIEVLALDVLDERHGDGGLVGHTADDGRHNGQAGDLRCAPAALTGDDLVALRAAIDRRCQGPHHDGLDDTLAAYRNGQLFEGFLTQVGARLIAAALQQIDRQADQFVAGRGLVTRAGCHGHAGIEGHRRGRGRRGLGAAQQVCQTAA